MDDTSLNILRHFIAIICSIIFLIEAPTILCAALIVITLALGGGSEIGYPGNFVLVPWWAFLLSFPVTLGFYMPVSLIFHGLRGKLRLPLWLPPLIVFSGLFLIFVVWGLPILGKSLPSFSHLTLAGVLSLLLSVGLCIYWLLVASCSYEKLIDIAYGLGGHIIAGVFNIVFLSVVSVIILAAVVNRSNLILVPFLSIALAVGVTLYLYAPVSFIFQLLRNRIHLSLWLPPLLVFFGLFLVLAVCWLRLAGKPLPSTSGLLVVGAASLLLSLCFCPYWLLISRSKKLVRSLLVSIGIR